MKRIILFFVLFLFITIKSYSVSINHYSYEHKIPSIEPTTPLYFGSVQIRCATYMIDGEPREACMLNCGGSGGNTCDWSTATSCDCDENVGPSDVLDRIIESESDDLMDYAENQVYNNDVMNGNYNSNIIKSGISYNRTVIWNTNSSTNVTTIVVNVTKITP